MGTWEVFFPLSDVNAIWFWLGLVWLHHYYVVPYLLHHSNIFLAFYKSGIGTLSCLWATCQTLWSSHYTLPGWVSLSHSLTHKHTHNTHSKSKQQQVQISNKEKLDKKKLIFSGNNINNCNFQEVLEVGDDRKISRPCSIWDWEICHANHACESETMEWWGLYLGYLNWSNVVFRVGVVGPLRGVRNWGTVLVLCYLRGLEWQLQMISGSSFLIVVYL